MRKPPPISTNWPREMINTSRSSPERRQRQIDRGRIVVDHQGSFGAGQLTQQTASVVMAAAALPGSRSYSRLL